MEIDNNLKVVVLVGGVGGAKLAFGLAQILPPENLSIIVNVADDFWYYGLRVCPDSDTIMYTLSGLVDKTNGWGLSGDTTQMLDTLRGYGEDPWFTLRDRDLATHLLRTQMLHQGKRLTEVTRHLSQKLGVQCALLPATDQTVMTVIDTVEYGELEFQEYFVKYRWQPQLKSITYRGAERARITPEVKQVIDQADVILVGPSNPWLSIQPILAIPEMCDRLIQRNVPRVAVTPIIGGQAVKGPAAKIMRELGCEVSPDNIIEFYGELINGFIIDQQDANLQNSHLKTTHLNTMMLYDEDKINFAKQLLIAIEKWR